MEIKVCLGYTKFHIPLQATHFPFLYLFTRPAFAGNLEESSVFILNK